MTGTGTRLLALIFLFLTHTVLAQPKEAGSGVLALRRDGETIGQAVHLGTDIRMEIQGMSNRVQIHQRFTNTSSEWVEGVYTFPLPEDSAVNSMRVVLDERELVAVIREKMEARREYDAARREGKKAALTEQQRPNIFTQSVANIAPGETVDVYLQFLQPVRYEGGQFSVRYPMTITPRYSPGMPIHTLEDYSSAPLQTHTLGGWAVPTTQVPDADRISPHYLAGGESNQATLGIALHAGLPLVEVTSPTHALGSQLDADDPNLHHLTFMAGSEAMDRDFVLTWRPQQGQAPLAASFAETVSEQGVQEHYVQLMLLPPQQMEPRKTAARELVIVLDTSGSMGGESIVAARQSVLQALDTLGPGDAFNLVEFNSDYRTLFPAIVPATGENLAQARRFVTGLVADGGTNMMPALEAALAQNRVRPEDQAGRVRQIVFITDGSVGNEQAIFGLISERLGNSRLFTVGIGSAPNSYFMTSAAEQGRGSYVYIENAVAVREGMTRLFSKLEYPVVTDIALQWPAGMVVEQFPAVIPDLYLGEPVVVTARVTGAQAIDGTVGIAGRTGDAAWTRELALNPGSDVSTSLPGSGLAALWGRQKIAGLMNGLWQGTPREEVRRAVIPVSERFQLLSEFTSFIAVEQAISRPQERALMGAHVPLDAPQGQTLAALMAGQGQGVRVVMPATASGWGAHVLKGVIALLLLLVTIGLFRSEKAQS